MLSLSSDSFSLSSLKDIDPENFNWFGDRIGAAGAGTFAGRCLLDAIEYLRFIPPFTAEFRQVTNAHTIRLVCGCLRDLGYNDSALGRIRTYVASTCRQLRLNFSNDPPRYGDDFWDWAMVLWALEEAQRCLPGVDGLTDDLIADELAAFHDCVAKKIETGLTIPENETREWYGPATAAAAYQLLDRHRDRFGASVSSLLTKLKEQALTPVKDGKYGSRIVKPYQRLWHYGQVVAIFGPEAVEQVREIADFSALDNATKTDRVYALARMLQGALRVRDEKTREAALDALYKCEDQGRPLGEGLVGDNVKGSLNVLEAVWPLVSTDALRKRSRIMVDTLKRARLRANTIGVVVTIENEENAIRQVFKDEKVRAKEMEDAPGTIIFEHENYRVVVCRDKAIIGVHEATKKLIDTHKVKWLIMVGIAGSLAKFVHRRGKRPQRVGPGADFGEVVIATSLAPYRIYQKIRKKIENAKVPFRGKQWSAIPTDPILFGLAHEAAEQLFGKRFHEGLVVTGTAVVDLLRAKKDVLAEYPGGLAVETEGYTVGLICMLNGVNYLVIRGISDRADGSKKKQKKTPEVEEKEQFDAAFAAARIAAGVVTRLSRRW